jgi:serine/threonine-protein kinase RsbT
LPFSEPVRSNGDQVMADEIVVPIRTDADVVQARQRARTLAQPLRFTSSELTLIATAISEVARNIVSYAGRGDIILMLTQKGTRRGIRVIARDSGPGIPDVARALEDGYSTSRGLGLGLPGSKRLMDEFELVSTVGKGTQVTMVKWER